MHFTYDSINFYRSRKVTQFVSPWSNGKGYVHIINKLITYVPRKDAGNIHSLLFKRAEKEKGNHLSNSFKTFFCGDT